MNLYTSNSRSFKKYFLFPLGLYFLLTLSVIAFLIYPAGFYFRAWEYFNEIVYHIPSSKIWDRYEQGDFSRTYIFSLQSARKTHVSCNEEGCRSVPFVSDSYPVLIAGDSNIWGNGLSDDETIPWRIAERLEIPVYNVAKKQFTLDVVLDNPKLKDTKLIVEMITRGHMYPFYIGNPFKIKRYEPFQFAIKAIGTYSGYSYLNFLKIHPKRYFFPYKLVRYIRLQNIVAEFSRYFLQQSPQIKINRAAEPLSSEAEVHDMAGRMIKRAKEIEELGYSYVFAMLPDRHTILVDEFDEEIIYLDAVLKKRLEDSGIQYIDISTKFREHPDRPSLFQPIDTHISAEGAEYITEIVVDYLNQNQALILERIKGS